MWMLWNLDHCSSLEADHKSEGTGSMKQRSHCCRKKKKPIVLVSTCLPPWHGGHQFSGSSTFFRPTRHPLHPHPDHIWVRHLRDLNHTVRVYSLSHDWSKPTLVTWHICSLTQDREEAATLSSSWKLLFLRLSWDMGTWWSWSGLRATLYQWVHQPQQYDTKWPQKPFISSPDRKGTGQLNPKSKMPLFHLWDGQQCSLIGLEKWAPSLS